MLREVMFFMEPLAIKKCANCGKEFPIYHKKRLDKEYVTCSRKCMGEMFQKRKFIEHPENIITCPVCNKQFYIKPSEKSDAIGNCCSYECSYKLRSIKYSGEGNHQYGLKGELNASFKGERVLHCGYYWVHMPEHPFAVQNGRVREHRVIAEKYLLTEENSVMIDGKRYLSPEYDVHHIDGNKLNNSPDNLMVLTRSEHSKLHNKLKSNNK